MEWLLDPQIWIALLTLTAPEMVLDSCRQASKGFAESVPTDGAWRLLSARNVHAIQRPLVH